MRYLVLLMMLGAAAAAQQPPGVDLQAVGPRIGEVAPDFELPDQKGTPRTLSSLMGPKGAMLVFYRSADW